jgi:hypothetical protein
MVGNEILSFSAKWMEVESIMLGKIIQKHKDKCVFSFMWKLNKVTLNVKYFKRLRRVGVCMGLGKGRLD